MKSCLNHVSFSAGCKRCAVLNAPGIALPGTIPTPAVLVEPEELEDDETLQE
jgi:hypothetical protein